MRDQPHPENVKAYTTNILEFLKNKDLSLKGLVALFGNWGRHDNGPEAPEAFAELGIGMMRDSLGRTVVFVQREDDEVESFIFREEELETELNKLEDELWGREEPKKYDFEDDEFDPDYHYYNPFDEYDPDHNFDPY